MCILAQVVHKVSGEQRSCGYEPIVLRPHGSGLVLAVDVVSGCQSDPFHSVLCLILGPN